MKLQTIDQSAFYAVVSNVRQKQRRGLPSSETVICPDRSASTEVNQVQSLMDMIENDVQGD
jgi:predicted DNA-binding protein (UPF0278 family)